MLSHPRRVKRLRMRQHFPRHANFWFKSVYNGRIIESSNTLREGRGNLIRVSKICNPRRACRVLDVANLGNEDGIPSSLPQCGDWLFFSFLSKNVQNISKTHTRRVFSRLFGVDVLWRHRWITSGMGLSHPPGWDNISPDVKIGGYSCLESENPLFPPECSDIF